MERFYEHHLTEGLEPPDALGPSVVPRNYFRAVISARLGVERRPSILLPGGHLTVFPATTYSPRFCFERRRSKSLW